MKNYKLYLKYFLILTVIVILFNLIVWNIYTKQIFPKNYVVGDLARMSYQINAIHQRTNTSDLNKTHINYDDWKGQSIDIITIGDSFSNAGGGGLNAYYQDYLASFTGSNILNIQASNYGFIETVIGLKSSGILKSIKPKYIILQSVERSCIGRYSKKINFNLHLSYEKMQNEIRKKYKSVKQSPMFLTHLNFNALFYNVFYKYDDNAFYSDVYKIAMSKELFTTEHGSELLFYYEDLKSIPLSNKQSVEMLNDNLNKLQIMLDEENIKLIFMPTVDKYNLYSKYIDKNIYPESLFFEELRKLNKKYYFVDTKGVLENLINNDIKDVYYGDDTHWSWKASEEIAKILNEKLFLKNKN